MSPETHGRAVVVGAFALFTACTIGGAAYLMPEWVPNPAVQARAVSAPSPAATAAGTHGDGYSRAQFGADLSRADPDRNGCDTRNDVLGRWVTDAAVATDGCTVLQGVLVDPYSGATVQFRRGTPQPVQIDHVVSLHEAWHAGANAWLPSQREAFANDTSNLLPTTLNSSKGDRGPADLLAADEANEGKWQPSPEGACRYAQAHALVAAEWLLDIATEDRQARAAMLRKCP